MIYTTANSRIGELLLWGDGQLLRGLQVQAGRQPAKVGTDWQRRDDAFGEVSRQLEEYFGGRRQAFDVALGLEGSPFQLRVWQALRGIGYGGTISYTELAARIGSPRAVRAVGLANSRNPVAVIVPCHRVIGADGRLTGYAGGLENKRLLLELEGVTCRGR